MCFQTDENKIIANLLGSIAIYMSPSKIKIIIPKRGDSHHCPRDKNHLIQSIQNSSIILSAACDIIICSYNNTTQAPHTVVSLSRNYAGRSACAGKKSVYIFCFFSPYSFTRTHVAFPRDVSDGAGGGGGDSHCA